MGGPPGSTNRFGEEEDNHARRCSTRVPSSRTATTLGDNGPKMPLRKNQNDDGDLEGQVVDGNPMGLSSLTIDDQQTPTIEEELLRVNAYVVGEPSVEQKRGATISRSIIMATVLQNETQVDARIWWFVRGLVVIAMALCIALPLTLRDHANNAELETPSPAPAPKLKDPWLILQPIITDGGSKDDIINAQKAYRWLIVEDQSAMLEDPTTPEWRILQRFVLANFYFATNGTGWSNQLRFLSKDDECTWKQTIPYTDSLWSIDGFDVTSLPAGVIQCDTQGRIQSLRIAQNGLQNTIPSVLRYFSDLKELGLDGNNFDRSPVPSMLGDLTGLELLDLTGCSLSGTIPTELKSLTNLQQLWLNHNHLTGTIPSSLFISLSDLRVLGLGTNFLTGTLPSEIGRLYALEYLELSDNTLVGALPDAWNRLTNLEAVFLYDNLLTGRLPDAWGSWTNVQFVNLYDNNLAGTLPEAWSQWTALLELYLDQNALTGPLPETWSEWSNVEFVYLYENNLTGRLPDRWSQWSNLIDLELASNALTGPLPDAWGEWPNVETVGLSENNLTGTLPESWNQWTALLRLALNGNLLTGTLPNVWNQLTSLEYVWLYNNYLTGTLPASYASWKNILDVSFSTNCLEGTIPLEYHAEWTSLEVRPFWVFGIQRVDCSEGNQTST